MEYTFFMSIKGATMTRGVLFIVFGDYYKLAIKTITYSRKFTNLPFQVLHNVKELPDIFNLENITLTYLDMDTNQNRQVKTTMHNYSIFDETIYIDVDAVIQNNGIEEVFKLFDDDKDLLLVQYGYYSSSDAVIRRPSPYSNIFKKSGIVGSVCIYFGAFIGFKKNERTTQFFNTWNYNWTHDGCGREMPALAITMHDTIAIVKKILLTDNVFAWKPLNMSAIVQHEFGNGPAFWDKYFNGDKEPLLSLPKRSGHSVVTPNVIVKKNIIRNAFIDCGSYKCAVSKMFKSMNPKYKIYSFECHPGLHNLMNRPGIIKINKAAWTHDGVVKCFIQNSNRLNGKYLSLYQDYRYLTDIKESEVECIDFSSWLKTKFSPNDNVVVNIDTTGSEYEILNKCIEDGTIDLIKKLYVIWNKNNVPSLINKHEPIIQKLARHNVNLVSNYNDLYIGN